MNSLKQQLIRLGKRRPELRKHLTPIIDRVASHRVASSTFGDLIDLMRQIGLEAPDEPAYGADTPIGMLHLQEVMPLEGGITDMIFQAIERNALQVGSANVTGDKGNFYVGEAEVTIPWHFIADEYLVMLDDYSGQYASSGAAKALSENGDFQRMVTDSFPTDTSVVNREMPAPLQKVIDSNMTIPDDVVNNPSYEVKIGNAEWDRKGLSVTYKFRLPKFK